MAFQDGLIKLVGTMGGLSFYKSGNEYLARTKGGATAERINHDPRFVRTREVNNEVASAGKAAKISRLAFSKWITPIADKYMTSRLVKALVQVIRTDEVNPRGKRNMMNSNAGLLEGFEFNENRKLHEVLRAPFSTSVDHTIGAVKITFDNLIPLDDISFPEAATHCKLVAFAAEIDFKSEAYTSGSAESEPIPLRTTNETTLLLHPSITVTGEHPLFISIGIIFFQQVNNGLYSLKDKTHHALALTKVV